MRILIFLLFTLNLNAQTRQFGLQIDTKNRLSICYSQQETFLRFEIETGLEDFDKFYINSTMKGTLHLKEWVILGGLGVEFRKSKSIELFRNGWQRRTIFEGGVVRKFCHSELQLNYWLGDKYPSVRFRQYIK